MTTAVLENKVFDMIMALNLSNSSLMAIAGKLIDKANASHPKRMPADSDIKCADIEEARRFIDSLTMTGGQEVPNDERGIEARIEKYL